MHRLPPHSKFVDRKFFYARLVSSSASSSVLTLALALQSLAHGNELAGALALELGDPLGRVAEDAAFRLGAELSGPGAFGHIAADVGAVAELLVQIAAH